MAEKPKWSRQELAVVDRCVQGVAEGRYQSRDAASKDCMKQLEALRRRQSVPGGPGFRRTVAAVQFAIDARRKRAGLPPAYNHWLEPENRIIERFVEAMRLKRYDSLVVAARECHHELERLRASPDCPLPRPTARGVQAVYVRLMEAVKGRNLTWPHHFWSDEELRAARRFACACRAGKYASIGAAARACQRELARKSNRPRQFDGVHWHVYKEARRLGGPWTKRRWTTTETRILQRYVGLLLDRRYRLAREAARDCHRALGGARTYEAVFDALIRRASATGVPRYHSSLTPRELRVAERYAMMVQDGRFPHWKAAAIACRSELSRRTDRTGRIGGLQLRHADAHSLEAIRVAILKIAHSRNLRGPRNPHWSNAEDRMARSWVRWYGRYRLVRKLAPRRQAGEGLSDELGEAGFHRNVSACSYRVSLLWRRQHGLV